MKNPSDSNLLQYVNKIINSGSTTIEIPAYLVQAASKGALETVRQLCKLNGVKITNIKGGIS